MTSSAFQSLAKKAEQAKAFEKSNDPKIFQEESRILKLLSLISAKITERFKNLRECFRYIDTDHSSNISLNEFAQAIDFFRLKISFEDITKLFRFLDENGNG